MEQKYFERIINRIKDLSHNKYVLATFIILFLSLCISAILVFSNYKKAQDQSAQKENIEIENEKDSEENTPIPEDTQEDPKQNLDTSTISPEETAKPPKSEKPVETETPIEQTPEEEPEEEPQPPESPSAVVAFYADTQSDTDQEDLNHQRVVNYILSSGANPVFHAGDVMEDGTQASLDRFNNVTATLRASRTFYAALGNNDRQVGDSTTPSQLFLDNFVFPNNEKWYSVNYGNLHLIVLDSAFSAGSTSQLSWLASDLQSSNSQNRITGVMYHHPTFTSTISSHLINYGADFVVAGHVHAYGHSVSNGINYFTLSGQPSIGYMVARIYSDKVSITVYNSGNGVIDTVEFTER